jgi:hypothetical protein
LAGFGVLGHKWFQRAEQALIAATAVVPLMVTTAPLAFSDAV